MLYLTTLGHMTSVTEVQLLTPRPPHPFK